VILLILAQLTGLIRSCIKKYFGVSRIWAALFLIPIVHAADSAELAPLANRSLLLGIVNTGQQLVAVGDHGHVLRSSDQGQQWTQQITPTRALLTSVSFPDAQHGWAVGHDGVIIATRDRGETWVRQDDGQQLETIFLSVLFLDRLRGFAVGAYGKYLYTIDGGAHWVSGHPSDEEAHFNRISAGVDGTLYLAGESGICLRSSDGGQIWHKVEVPYDGSLFGVLPLTAQRIVTYGLRGHIFRSDDQGARWVPLSTDVKVLIMGGIRLRQGPLVLSGQGGNFFISRDGGRSFQHWKPADFGTSVADLIEADDGAIITVGEAGVTRLHIP